MLACFFGNALKWSVIHKKTSSMLIGIISKQLGNKLELREIFDKDKEFDLFRVSGTHLLPKN